MLKTYRIIPFVFILFLFGFTLITVSPVFAQEQWNPSMGMCHNSRPCMKMNNCGRMCDPDVRESKGWVNPNGTSKPNTKIACKKRGGTWGMGFSGQFGCREKSQASEASTGKVKCDYACQFDAEQKLKRDKVNCSKLIQWGQPGYANYVNACTSCSDRVKGKTYAEKCR